jgi:hypothetical protein
MAICFRRVKMHLHKSLRCQINDRFHADRFTADALTGYGMTDIQCNPRALAPSPVEEGLWIRRRSSAKVF